MNKQALKLKKQRRLLKEQEKQKRIDRTWNEMVAFTNKYNLPLKEKKKEKYNIYKAVKEMNNKITVKTGVIVIICSLMSLYKCQYDKEEILQYSERLRLFILSMTSNNRSFNKILEELRDDFKIDVIKLCKNIPKLKDEELYKYDIEECIIKSTVEEYPYLLSTCIYAFINAIIYDNIVDEKQLNIFIDFHIEYYKNIINDISLLNKYKKFIYKQYKLDVNLKTGLLKEILD